MARLRDRALSFKRLVVTGGTSRASFTCTSQVFVLQVDAWTGTLNANIIDINSSLGEKKSNWIQNL
ncbi:hypothetical protein QQP08_007917 [Theobroma cacao]|nr:hypothetical protein QQP08_007917 [Theobroma cacao]